MANGVYTVTLKFAELYNNGPNQRQFNVDLQGQRVLTNFDVFAAAGGQYVAVDRTFSVTVTNGVLDLTLTNVLRDGKVNAIEIVPAPVSITASYAYNGDGLRVGKTVSGVTTSYASDPTGLGHVLTESGSGISAGYNEYLWGAGGLLAQLNGASGTPTYAHADGLGSIRLLTNASGSVVGTQQYDAFGVTRAAMGLQLV